MNTNITTEDFSKKDLNRYTRIWEKVSSLHNTAFEESDIIYKLCPQWNSLFTFIQWFTSQEKIYGKDLSKMMDFTLFGMNEDKEIIISPETFTIVHNKVKHFVKRMVKNGVKNKYLGVNIVSDTRAYPTSFTIKGKSSGSEYWAATPDFTFKHINRSSQNFLWAASQYIRIELLPISLNDRNALKLEGIASKLDYCGKNGKVIESFIDVI